MKNGSRKKKQQEEKNEQGEHSIIPVKNSQSDLTHRRTSRNPNRRCVSLIGVIRILILEMADSLTQLVISQLKTLKKSFDRKFAEIAFILVNHKSAGSLGALAGFAIAVLFTWKFLRSPAGPRRRQRKDTSSASTSGANFPPNGVTSLSENCQQLHNANDVEPVDDFYGPTKLVLAQTVKKKLYGCRKMTCQLLGVIVEECSPEQLQEHATVRSSVVEVLLEISKFCDIYLMERILDDDSGVLKEVVVALLRMVASAKRMAGQALSLLHAEGCRGNYRDVEPPRIQEFTRRAPTPSSPVSEPREPRSKHRHDVRPRHLDKGKGKALVDSPPPPPVDDSDEDFDPEAELKKVMRRSMAEKSRIGSSQRLGKKRKK